MIVNKEHLTEQGREKIKTIKSNMNSKRKSQIIMSKPYIETFLLFLLITFISCITYDLYNLFNINLFISMVKDVNADIEVNNIKVNGLDVAVDKIRDGSLYIGGMAATSKIIKSSSLPLGAKLGATVGMGAASLIGFKMIQNNLSSPNTQGNLDIKADKITSKINTNSNINKLVDNSNNNNETTISSLDIEQLNLDFYLHIVMIYLILIVIFFLIMKNISEREVKLDFIKTLPKGEYLENLFRLILK
jgi:hypothetical protein